MRILLQNAAIVITKCVAYYKMRRHYKMPQNSRSLSSPYSIELEGFVGTVLCTVELLETDVNFVRTEGLHSASANITTK